MIQVSLNVTTCNEIPRDSMHCHAFYMVHASDYYLFKKCANNFLRGFAPKKLTSRKSSKIEISYSDNGNPDEDVKSSANTTLATPSLSPNINLCQLAVQFMLTGDIFLHTKKFCFVFSG